MNKTLIALALALGVATSAAAQTPKHYLTLGADPEDKTRQPTANEVVIVSDTDVCDSGWGSGSGKKSPGCYHAGTAYIVNKDTHALHVVALCGNKPSDEHVITGKVVEMTIPTTPNAPQFDINAAILATIKQMVLKGELNVSGKVEVDHNVHGNVTVTHEGEVDTKSSKSADNDAFKEHHGFPIRTIALIAGGVAVFAIYEAHKGGDKKGTYTPPIVIPPTATTAKVIGFNVRFGFK